MKKIVSISLILFLFIFMVLPCSAEIPDFSKGTYFVDEAHVISSLTDANDINQHLSNICQNGNYALLIATVDLSYIDETLEDYAENILDSSIYLDVCEGVALLLLDTSTNQYMLSKIGNSNKVSESEINFIVNHIDEEIQNREYYQAFWKYANICDVFINSTNDLSAAISVNDYSPFMMPISDNMIPKHRLLSYVVDENHLLSDGDIENLENKLESISSQYQCDVAVVTVYSLGNRSSMEFADDYFDYNGFGYGNSQDGIVLLISMQNRDWWISTCGSAINSFNDNGIDSIGGKVVNKLSNGNYYEACNVFADQCEEFLSYEVENGVAYAGDSYQAPNNSDITDSLALQIVIALIVSFLAGIIGANILKGQLKSVHSQPNANQYLREGSFVLTTQQDIFRYSNVIKTVRQTESSGGGGGSSTHSSSSGSSHGGGGGHF